MSKNRGGTGTVGASRDRDSGSCFQGWDPDGRDFFSGGGPLNGKLPVLFKWLDRETLVAPAAPETPGTAPASTGPPTPAPGTAPATPEAPETPAP